MARGGFPGGMNMQNMMRQAQQMQLKMQKMQEELEQREVTAQAGGGVVSVTVTGKKVVKSITIKPEAVDPDDVEMLEDLVMVAVNSALRQVEEASKASMSRLTGGMGGGFSF